jgi:hypothetical protein
MLDTNIGHSCDGFNLQSWPSTQVNPSFCSLKIGFGLRKWKKFHCRILPGAALAEAVAAAFDHDLMNNLNKNVKNTPTRFLERCFQNKPGWHILFMAKKTPKSVTKANSSQKRNLVTLIAFCLTTTQRHLAVKDVKTKTK